LKICDIPYFSFLYGSLAVCLLGTSSTYADFPKIANPNYKKTAYESENAQRIEDIKSQLDKVKRLSDNQEMEISILKEKIETQDTIIESVQKETKEAQKSQQEYLKTALKEQLDSVSKIDTQVKASSATANLDLQRFKQSLTEATNLILDLQKRIKELEKITERQARESEHLQATLKALTEALGDSSSPSIAIKDKSSTGYKVKAGDSLEKIAKQFKTTSAVLRQMNQLQNDRIKVGQVLNVPES